MHFFTSNLLYYLQVRRVVVCVNVWYKCSIYTYRWDLNIYVYFSALPRVAAAYRIYELNVWPVYRYNLTPTLTLTDRYNLRDLTYPYPLPTSTPGVYPLPAG